MSQEALLERARELIRGGCADEEVERQTGLSLTAILVLRAAAAARPLILPD